MKTSQNSQNNFEKGECSWKTHTLIPRLIVESYIWQNDRHTDHWNQIENGKPPKYMVNRFFT